jgi:RNA polymerase II elongation factor ELL
MAADLLPDGGIALVGAPDANPSTPSLPAMHVEITQDIVDELLASMRSGKAPHIVFGRTPVRLHPPLCTAAPNTPAD